MDKAQQVVTRLLSLGAMSPGTLLSAMEDLGFPSRPTQRSIQDGLDRGLWKFGEQMKLALTNTKEGQGDA